MNPHTTQARLLDALMLVLGGMLLMWPLGNIWPFTAVPKPVLWLALVLAPLVLLFAWHGYRKVQQKLRFEFVTLQNQLTLCRQNEQDLQARQNFYQTILEDIPEMVCRWQPDGQISYVNDAYCRYFGISAEDVMRQGYLAHFRPNSGNGDPQGLNLYREHPVVTVEFFVPQADGSVRWQRWLDKALFNEQGELCEFQSIGEDITARKLAEDEAARLLEEKKRLARMALAIQEQERAHLARELHDELGQSLTAIRADAQCVLHLNRGRSATIQDSAESIDRVAGQVYQVVNGMMHRLRPVLLDDLGLEDALQELLSSWRNRHPEVILQVNLSKLPDLDTELELTLFRIVQEALTNVAKHAHANHMEVALLQLGNSLHLTIHDDGVGFANTRREHGYGLLGMRERCLAVAGEFTLTSHRGCGTTLHAVLPLFREQDNGSGRN